MSEWQPIETAPRGANKERILVGSRFGFVDVAIWAERFSERYGDTAPGWYSVTLDRRIYPTHWMPIPHAPIHPETGED